MDMDGAFYVYNGVLRVELPARSRGRARESGGKAESFEAILHLKECPKLAKTLLQSKYDPPSHSWGTKVHGAPNPTH